MNNDPTGAAKAVELGVENISAAIRRCAGEASADALIEEAREILLSVISAIVAADSRLDPNEQTFMDYLVDTSTSPRGMVGVIIDYATKWDRIKNQVPQFLQNAVAYDQRNHSGIAGDMMREIQLVCNNACVSDGTASKQESAIVREFIANLEKYLFNQGQGCLTPRIVSKQTAAAPTVTQMATPAQRPAPSLDQEALFAELKGLVGMEEVKAQVRSFTDFLRIELVRTQRGLARHPLSLHSIFVGPPGTGKTTIARLLGKIFAALGFLQKGHLIETDRAGLVGAYLGQTALKVDALVQQAKGGILFIDEAYSLKLSQQDQYGQEAIDTLLKRMEDLRGELAVFVAGYPDEMKTFVEANPGLKSRFNRFYSFDHYTPAELGLIFERICAAQGFTLGSDARIQLDKLLLELCRQRDKTFGNGRLARNLFEKAVERQAVRLSALTRITDTALTTLEASDLGQTPSSTDTVQAPDTEQQRIPRSLEHFLDELSEFEREVGKWFVAAAERYGQKCFKSKSRAAIELKRWTAFVSFSQATATFYTGYGTDDVAGHYSNHVKAMVLVPGSEIWLRGPTQSQKADSYCIAIENPEAFHVAQLVFDAFANATVSDGE